jgi:hypothetical protein
MNNSGSPDQQPAVETGAVGARRAVPWRLIIVGGLALLLALVIGTQVIGVLYAMAFPPSPPLPDSVMLASHANPSYGVDDWVYQSSSDPCSVAVFYEAAGANCEVAPLWCDGNEYATVYSANQHVARCFGTTPFSIFTMHWQVLIASGSDSSTPTEFRLRREVSWVGAPSPAP